MRVRLLLVAVLVLLLTLLLALALQGFARDIFLVELGRAYWEVRALFESVPQVALWVLLLLALLVMAAKSLFRRRGPPQKRAEEEVATAGRVLVLTRQIQQASKGDYFKWSLARYLGDLTCEVLAQQVRATPEQLRRRLRAGKLDLRPTASPGIQEYLEFGRAPLSATPNGFFSRLWARWGTADQPPASDPTLEGVVEFLEERLIDASGGST